MGRIWASISGVGQFRLDDDTWTFVPVLPGRPDMTALAAHTGEDGRVWLAYPDSLAVIDGSDTRIFPASEIGVGAIRTIGGRAGLLWVGGETGLAVLRDTRFIPARQAHAESPLGSVSSLVATAQHGLWLNADARIVHLPQSEIDRLLSDPGHQVAFDTFDLISDLPEPLQDHQMGETVIEDRNGTLWFVTQHRVARLDPGRIRRNALPPPVVVRTLTADDRYVPSTRPRAGAGAHPLDPDRLHRAQPHHSGARQVPLSSRGLGNGVARRGPAPVGVLHGSQTRRLQLPRPRLQQRRRVE